MSKKDIKLIALDMDGTLLNKEGILTKRTQNALLSAMKNDVHVVIATGRVLSAFPEHILNFSGIEYVVSSNGARIVRLADRESIYTNFIETESAKALIPFIFKEDLFLEIFYEGDVFVEKASVDNLETYGLPKRYVDYMLSTRTSINDLQSAMEEHIDRLENINVNFGNQDRKAKFWEASKSFKGITATSSFSHNIELGGATTSKADGVAFLCKKFGIEAYQVMACGDNYNDLSMLKFAGVSVAVENADEIIKSQVDFVTKSNEEDGVALAIEKFVLL